jgi:PAS domain S-box-containing protein
MFDHIRNFLKPPVWKNEKDRHTAHLLRIILWALIALPVPYVAHTIFYVRENSARALTQGGISLAVNLFLLFLLHKGFARLAAALQVSAFWVFFTVSAVTGVGVQGESYLLGYPLVIVIAGILLGGEAAMVVTAASLLAGLGMMQAEQAGIIVTSMPRPPFLTWVVSAVIFPMSAVLQYLSHRTVQQALERARLSEEKYRLISTVSSDYTFESEVDERGNARAIWAGGAFEKMTGYTFEDYSAKGGWYQHIHPDDLEKDEEDMRKLLNNEEVIGSEIRTYAKDGSIRWERVFAHPVWNEAENRLAGIIGAVQDITAQKEAEALLKETLLQQAAILNNIPDIAWLKDTESRYIAVNEQFVKVNGRRMEEIIGRTDHDIWGKSFADHYREDDLEVIRIGRRKELEETLQDHTGKVSWIETSKTPIRNSQGEITGTIGIARDITERKQAELERERLIAELETKNAELERFTYTVSHDLKSPLVTITGFLMYLEKSARAGNFDQFHKDLERIRQAVEKMQTLLKDLLELSRIGRLMNEATEVTFGDIVRDALALTDGQIKARGVQVEFNDEGHTLFGDRIRLMEVLQNLIDNAVKFMGDQPQPRIRLGARTETNGTTAFFVQDNGIGIEPKFQDRIFGLFNKLDANTHGSGVGLAIVKRIIEVHGGSIWVESQPGAGATFFFTVKERNP